jgi:hypothetical protein
MEGRDVDPGRPSIARLYDYILGGKQNFEVDRRAARFLYGSSRVSNWWRLGWSTPTTGGPTTSRPPTAACTRSSRPGWH